MPREIITFLFFFFCFLIFSALGAELFLNLFFFHPSGSKGSLSCRARSCISKGLGKPLKEQTRRRKSPR